MVVTEVTVRYHRPARYEDQITVRAWIAEMQSRGMTFQYEIVNAITGELLVTGVSKHICTTQDGQIAKVPAAWREWGNR